MAVAFVKNHTVTGNKVAGTTFDLTLNTDVPPGNLLVARILYDNAGTASKPLVSSIARAAGETAVWQVVSFSNSTSTSAGAFVSGTMRTLRTSVIWPAGNYTVTLDTSVTQKAGFLQEFSGVLASNSSGLLQASNYSTTTTAASATTTNTAPAIGDLAIGFIFGSNVAVAQAGDTDTTGGSWSAVAGVGTTGGSGATNNFGIGQYKVLTAASHQTLNNSAAMTAGNAAIVTVLAQIPYGATTQAAYRIYDDGTETDSTALAAQDTGHTVDAATSDVNLQVRFRLQNGAFVYGTDWQLEYRKNAGAWTTVTGASSNVTTYDSASLTDLAATTNRLTGGTGTFTAGKVSETGTVFGPAVFANNHTEILYSVTLKAADLVDTDVLEFRVTRAGSTTNITYSQTPTITINPPAGTTVNGTGDGAWGAWTGTAAATVFPTVLGVAAGNWGALTGIGAGVTERSATGLGSWGALTGTALGQTTRSAAGLGSWGALTGTAEADVDHTATAAGNWGALTGTASGGVPSVEVPGSAVGAWGALTATGLGQTSRTATGAGQWGSLTATATAAVAGTITGAGVGQWGAWTATATGTVSSTGTGLGAWGALTATAAATVTSATIGIAEGQWGALTATATTATTYPVQATGAWGGWTGTATAAGAIAASATGSWGGWIATGLATVAGVKGTVGGAVTLGGTVGVTINPLIAGSVGGSTIIVVFDMGGEVELVGSAGGSVSPVGAMDGNAEPVGTVGGTAT